MAHFKSDYQGQVSLDKAWKRNDEVNGHSQLTLSDIVVIEDLEDMCNETISTLACARLSDSIVGTY